MPKRNRGYTYRTTVRATDDGQTALDMMSARYRHSDRATWAERFARGELCVGMHRLDEAARVRAGQVIDWRRPPWVEPDVPWDVAVVFEDADLLIVRKPSGLPTMPAGGFLEHTLWAWTRQRWPSASPMHRLGTGTSGLIAFGLTAEARGRLQAAWRARDVRKCYAAWVEGDVDVQTVRVPIGPVPHELLGTIYAADHAGRDAVTHVRPCRRDRGRTLVHATIETGRPHQIRIHMAAIGHPLVGDPLYLAGGGARPDARPTDLGYWLHSRELAFRHPSRDEVMRWLDEASWESAPPWA